MAAYQAYYEVLGLDAPPTDRKAVKRAYSKMLKVTRPEDDPEGFMRLRNAHDTALNIVAREAEEAKWEAEQAKFNAPISQLPESKPQDDKIDDDKTDNELTYEDMLPEKAPHPFEQHSETVPSETGYSIGPTASLDAPLNTPEEDVISESQYAQGASPTLHIPFTSKQPSASPKPVEPQTPPLLHMLEDLLDTPKNYNDREKWNQLFRQARLLDIDDYVDFEDLLLNTILNFHGYYDNDNPNYNTPEKLPQKLSPSIAASLFKTMHWDQVNTQGNHRGHQIEWLERRMIRRKYRTDSVPIPETESSSSGSIWMILLGLFLLAKLIQFLVNS